MDAPISFGYWIRRRRKALDLTQDELAHQVGCSVMTIRKIEAGGRRPSRQIPERLADCLEIAPADHAIFIKVARAHVSVEQLADPMERTVQVSIVPATRTFSTSTPAGSEELMHSTQAPVIFSTGTVTFLLSGIEDSISLWEQYSSAMNPILVRYASILRDAVTA